MRESNFSFQFREHPTRGGHHTALPKAKFGEIHETTFVLNMCKRISLASNLYPPYPSFRIIAVPSLDNHVNSDQKHYAPT